MTKQQLSERIAELYNVRAFKDINHPLIKDTTWLIDDTARMFELAVEHDIYYVPNNLFAERGDCVEAFVDLDELESNVVTVLYKDHPTKLEATLYAIGLALVKKAESAQ